MADRAVGIPIVKEGLPFVGGLVGATLLFGAAGWIIPAVIAGGFTLFTAWFFRNPSRTIPQQPNVVVSSGDGKVVAIEEEFEPRYLCLLYTSCQGYRQGRCVFGDVRAWYDQRDYGSGRCLYGFRAVGVYQRAGLNEFDRQRRLSGSRQHRP